MLEKILIWTGRVFRRPLPIVIIAVAMTVFFAFWMPKIKFDSDITSMLPSDNRARVISEFYEDKNLFGSSDMVIVGIDTDDAYSEKTLTYVKKVEAAINGLNNILPQENMAGLLKLNKDDGAKVIEALRGVGINEMNYETELVPLITSADKLSESFGWDKAFAGKVATAAAAVQNKKSLFECYQNPINKTQSIVSADYIECVDDALVVKKLVDNEDIVPENINGLHQRVANWDVYKGALVSSDGKLTTIAVKLNGSNNDLNGKLSRSVESLLKANADPAFRTYLDGEPVINDKIARQMFSDLKKLIPLVVIMVLGILALCFKNIQGVAYPAASIAFAVISTMGFMAYCQVPVSVVGITIPVLLVAIVSAYGVHQMNHYFLSTETNKLSIVNHNMKSVGLAITLSGIAVMIGFGALVTEKFVPIKNFGIFTAIGDFIGLFGALYLIPALILLSKKPKSVVQVESSTGFISNILRFFQRVNRRHSKLILAGATVLCAAAFVGALGLKAELNNVSFFKKNAPIHVADDHLNEKLAGTEVLNLILDSDLGDAYQRGMGRIPENKDKITEITTPEVLNEIDKFSSDVQREFPYAQKVMSFNDAIKKMNQEMNGGAREFYRIPDSKDLISQYLMIFSGDISDVVTSNHDKLRVTITLKRVSSDEVEKVKRYCEAYFPKEFLDRNHLQLQISGTANLYNVANTLLVDGMIESIILCVIIVFVLLVIVLRNVRMSLIALVPIFMTILLNFGCMGFFHIPFNTVTALVSSVAIGIGVDYSIHFITWYRNELRAYPDIPIALEKTIERKGRGILYNMFVIFGGFIVLVVSDFVPLIQFGCLVSGCMIIATMGALSVVPAIIRILAKKNYNFLYLGVGRPSK
jgi:Predicted exporters of the RND superfamily